MRKVAAITGGGQGIGRAIALHFAKHDYDISLADVDREAGLEVIREIQLNGGNAMFMAVDVADEISVKSWFQLILAEYGRLDVLINNAGIGHGGHMLELPLEAFDRVIAVNLRGAFVCAQQAAKAMKKLGGGSIIQIASTRALMSEANTEAYAASKGGLLALTHAMAVSLGPLGIRVNAISPGWIETRDWQYTARAQTPEHSERDKLQHPVGRVGKPEDIAEACLFLAGNQSSFMTGQNLVIDGGMTIKMIYE